MYFILIAAQHHFAFVFASSLQKSIQEIAFQLTHGPSFPSYVCARTIMSLTLHCEVSSNDMIATSDPFVGQKIQVIFEAYIMRIFR